MGFGWVFLGFTQTIPKECARNVQGKPKRVIREPTRLVEQNLGLGRIATKRFRNADYVTFRYNYEN